MPEPTFTRDGYPTDEALEWLSMYNDLEPGGAQFATWLAFAEKLWSSYGSVRRVKREGQSCIRFATGGWSGNEDVIDAMRRNYLKWEMTWYSSRRGGEHIFLLREKRRQS